MLALVMSVTRNGSSRWKYRLGRVIIDDRDRGEVPEWLIGAVSKTVVVLWATVGSNPTLSAKFKQGGL